MLKTILNLGISKEKKLTNKREPSIFFIAIFSKPEIILLTLTDTAALLSVWLKYPMKAYFTGLLDIFILILFHTLPCCLSTSACWYCSVPLSLLLGGCEKWLDGTCDYSVVTHGFWYPSKKRSCLKHVIPVFEINVIFSHQRDIFCRRRLSLSPDQWQTLQLGQ